MTNGVTPRDEMNQLFDALLGFAQSMLEKHGEFYPAGAWIDSSGELGLVAGDDGTEHPKPLELLELLYGAMRERARGGTIRACAVCVDVRARRAENEDATDAIQVAIEHAAAEPVNVLCRTRGGDSAAFSTASCGLRRVNGTCSSERGIQRLRAAYAARGRSPVRRRA